MISLLSLVTSKKIAKTNISFWPDINIYIVIFFIVIIIHDSTVIIISGFFFF